MRLGALAVGDVAAGAAQPDELPGVVEDAHRVHQQPARVGIAREDAVLEVAEGAVRSRVLGEPLAHPLAPRPGA